MARQVAVAVWVVVMGCGTDVAAPPVQPVGPPPPSALGPPPSEPTPDPPTPPRTARELLAAPLTLALTPASFAQVTAHRSTDGHSQTVTLGDASGSVTLQAAADGPLAIAALDVELGAFSVGPDSFPPAGLSLEKIRLRLPGELDAAASWSGDGGMSGTATAELLLDWSLDAGGAAYPLATEHIAPVPIEIVVAGDGKGGLTFVLQASRDGQFWSWADLLDLSDLRLDVVAFHGG